MAYLVVSNGYSMDNNLTLRGELKRHGNWISELSYYPEIEKSSSDVESIKRPSQGCMMLVRELDRIDRWFAERRRQRKTNTIIKRAIQQRILRYK